MADKDVAVEQQPRKALPFIQPGMEPYWEGALKGELLLQRCQACGQYRHPASEVCPKCLGSEQAWVAASGLGTVYSFVIVRQALDKAWASEVPYCVAVVALQEGPHLLTNVTGIDMEDISVGLPVQVFFERASENIALPKFTPV